MKFPNGLLAPKQGNVRALTALLFALVAALSLLMPPTKARAQSGQLGINSAFVADFGPFQIFTDVMKHARHWGSVNAPYDQTAPEDSNGWPTSDAGVVVQTLYYDIGGTYKLTFNGHATVAPWNCSFTVQNQTFNSGTNTTTADVVLASGQTSLGLTFTGTGGGVQNVKLIRPGYPADGSQIFTTPFLNDLQYFSVFRAMDYLDTNDSATTSWAQRKLPTYATQSSYDAIPNKGGAYEYLILLANQTSKDIWINIPYHADDNYVTQLAQLFKNGNSFTGGKGLNPGLHLYVELSNEVWNYGFSQAGDNRQAAINEVNAGGSNLNYDGRTDTYLWASRLYSRRIARIASQFKSVWGASAVPSTIRPVLTWQVGSAGYNVSDGLDFINRVAGTPSSLVYAISSAPYLYIDDGPTGSVTGILNAWSAYSNGDGKSSNQQYHTVAAQYGVHYVAYEGGTSELQGSTNLSNKIAANQDSRLTAIIVNDIQTNFWGVGGELFTYYNLASTYDQYGCWGLSQNLSDTTGPKWAAIKQLAGSVVVGGSVQINAGGGAVSPFIADADYSGGQAYTNYTGAIDTSGVTSPAPQAVYQSERYGDSTYTIPGLTAGGSYTVRLHFAENYWTAAGQRVFNVAINGTQVLANFDIYATAGAIHKAVVKSFPTSANSSGQISIVFTTLTNNALVNGIEVTQGGGGGSLLTKVRFYPRAGWASRMNGGQFQGSNNNSTWTTLATLSAAPASGTYTSLNISTTTHYRYLRYLSPNGGYGNIAELQFYTGNTQLTGTAFGTAGSWNNAGNTFSKVFDGNTSTFFDAPDPGNGDYVGLDLGS